MKNDNCALESCLSYEERIEKQSKVALAEKYLENLGIKTKTDMYGYYRDTHDILKDIGEYLSKNGYKVDLNDTYSAVVEI